MKYMDEENEETQENQTEEPFVNMRFDVLSNSNNYSKESILVFIEKKAELTFTKNHFIEDAECMGIDNIYIGNIYTMNMFIYYFYHNLDSIISNYGYIYNPERMFFNESEKFFS